MLDLTVFGGRPVSVIDVVGGCPSRCFWSLEDSVSGMGVIGSRRLHGMDRSQGTFTATTGGVRTTRTRMSGFRRVIVWNLSDIIIGQGVICRIFLHLVILGIAEWGLSLLGQGKRGRGESE
jgi:hypothetical protein